MNAIVSEIKCPLCGKPVIEVENTSGNDYAGDYCSDSDCPWFSNQYTTYFDTVECSMP